MLLTKYYLGDQMEKNEIGGSYSTYGVRRGVYIVLVGNLSERGHLDDTGVDG